MEQRAPQSSAREGGALTRAHALHGRARASKRLGPSRPSGRADGGQRQSRRTDNSTAPTVGWRPPKARVWANNGAASTIRHNGAEFGHHMVPAAQIFVHIRALEGRFFGQLCLANPPFGLRVVSSDPLRRPSKNFPRADASPPPRAPCCAAVTALHMGPHGSAAGRRAHRRTEAPAREGSGGPRQAAQAKTPMQRPDSDSDWTRTQAPMPHGDACPDTCCFAPPMACPPKGLDCKRRNIADGHRCIIAHGPGFALSPLGAAPADMFTGQTFSRDPATSMLTDKKQTIRRVATSESKQIDHKMSEVARNRAKIGRCRPKVVKIARNWARAPKLARCFHAIVRNREKLAQLARNWGMSPSNSPNQGRHRPRFGRCCPKLVEIAPSLVGLGRGWPRLPQNWYKSLSIGRNLKMMDPANVLSGERLSRRRAEGRKC